MTQSPEKIWVQNPGVLNLSNRLRYKMGVTGSGEGIKTPMLESRYNAPVKALNHK